MAPCYLLEDKSGNIWISSSKEGGPGMSLSKYVGNSFTEIITKKDAPNPFNYQVFGTIEDRLGNIWFGTATGVYRYDGNDFTNFKGTEK